MRWYSQALHIKLATSILIFIDKGRIPEANGVIAEMLTHMVRKMCCEPCGVGTVI